MSSRRNLLSKSHRNRLRRQGYLRGLLLARNSAEAVRVHSNPALLDELPPDGVVEIERPMDVTMGSVMNWRSMRRLNLFLFINI